MDEEMATLADLHESFPFLRNVRVVNDEGDPLKGEQFGQFDSTSLGQAGGSPKIGGLEASMLQGWQGDLSCKYVKVQMLLAGTFGFISSGILTEKYVWLINFWWLTNDD